MNRDGQTGRPARFAPVKPGLENRAGPSKPTGSIFYPSPTHLFVPGCAGLGPGPNSGLRAELADLVLIGHLYL
jgi:hypothetical protein